MSCVIGLKYEGKVYLGADGRATTGDGEIRPIICNKLFENKGYLMGFCGSVRTGQLLYPHNFTPPKNILDFPKTVRQQFEENGALLQEPETGDMHGANILIAKNGKLFEILVDFQMSEVVSFTAIGSGSYTALGVLETLKSVKKLKPEDKILMALKICRKYVSSVGPPYEVKFL